MKRSQNSKCGLSNVRFQYEAVRCYSKDAFAFEDLRLCRHQMTVSHPERKLRHEDDDGIKRLS